PRRRGANPHLVRSIASPFHLAAFGCAFVAHGDRALLPDRPPDGLRPRQARAADRGYPRPDWHLRLPVWCNLPAQGLPPLQPELPCRRGFAAHRAGDVPGSRPVPGPLGFDPSPASATVTLAWRGVHARPGLRRPLCGRLLPSYPRGSFARDRVMLSRSAVAHFDWVRRLASGGRPFPGPSDPS